MKKFIILLFSILCINTMHAQGGTPDWYAYIDSVVNAKIAASGSVGLAESYAVVELTYVASPEAQQATITSQVNWNGTLSASLSNDTLTVSSTSSDFSNFVLTWCNRDAYVWRASSTSIKAKIWDWNVGSDKYAIFILNDY